MSANQERLHLQDTPLDALRRELAEESGDSAALGANPEENPVCSVRIDASLRSVLICWKRYATTRQLRFVHELSLALIREHDLDAILGDDTLIPAMHVQDRRWIVEDWLPRARAAGLRLISTKRPASHFGRVAADDVHDQAPSGVEVADFDTLEAARTWLRAQRAH